jgi:O-antigen/teichoic acid export membrane protein
LDPDRSFPDGFARGIGCSEKDGMSGARGSLLKGVADLASRAGGLITFPILIRYAGADGYGSLSQVAAVVSFIAPFASMGLSASMVRYFSIRDWTLSTRSEFLRILLRVLVSTALVGTAMAVVSSWLSHALLDYRDGTRLFAWGGLQIVIIASEQLILNFFRSRQWYSQSSFLELGQALLTVGATLMLIPRGFGIVDLLTATMLLKASLYAVFYASLWLWNKPRTEGTHEPMAFGAMVSFGISGIMAGLGTWMMNLGDRLVIGHYMRAEDLGHYSAAYNLAYLVMGVNAPLLLTLYPRIQIALSRKSGQEAEKEAGLFHRYISLVLIPATLFLICKSGPILGFLGGKGFDIDQIMVGMIILSVAIDQYNAVSHYVIYSKDQMVYNRNCWIFAGVLNLLLNWVLVPPFGLRGAGFATLATFIMLEIMITMRARRYMPLRKLYRIDTSAKAMLASAAGITAMFLAVGPIRPAKEHLFAAAFAFSATYLAALIAMREIKSGDIDLVRRALFGAKGHAMGPAGGKV